MAEIQAVEVEAPSPTIVRKTEIDKQAEEQRAKRELPKKPGEVVTFSEMCDWLKILTPEMQERILLYIYRTEPLINRQLVDPQAANSIDVLSDGFSSLTVDYFINNHGGGKYKIIVFDAGKKDLQRNGFFSANLSIPMLDCPPKLDLREVLWDESKNKGYKSWARAAKLIDENNMPTIEKKEASQTNNSDAMVQAMKLAMDFASKMDEKQQAQLKRNLGEGDALGKSIGEILLEKMKQDDPNKQLDTMTKLLGAMKGMQPEVRNNDSLATIMPIITLMLESGKQQFTMLMEVMKANAARPERQETDEVERLKQLIEVAKMMKGGPAPERSTAEVIVDAVTPIVGPVLGIVSNIIAMNAQARGVGAVAANPVQATPPAVAPNGAGATVAPPPKQIGNPNMELEQKQQLLKQFSPLIIKALGSSKEGWEFASDVENLLGVETVSILIKDGKDSLIGVAKSVPEFWNPLMQTYGEPHIVKWVGSFVDYKAEMEKMEEEESDESSVQ